MDLRSQDMVTVEGLESLSPSLRMLYLRLTYQRLYRWGAKHLSHLFIDLNATEYGAGDEGESVYGEKADFNPGLGTCGSLEPLVTPYGPDQWCCTIVVVIAMPIC